MDLEVQIRGEWYHLLAIVLGYKYEKIVVYFNHEYGEYDVEPFSEVEDVRLRGEENDR